MTLSRSVDLCLAVTGDLCAPRGHMNGKHVMRQLDNIANIAVLKGDFLKSTAERIVG